MHKALFIRFLALLAVNFQALAAVGKHSVEYYTGAALFHHCNRVIYFYLQYSEQFCAVIQPNVIHFSPVTVMSNAQRIDLTPEVVWSRSATCVLHVVINKWFFGTPYSKVRQFAQIRATQEMEFVLIFVAQPWSLSDKTATFRSQVGQNAKALAQLLRNYQNWLVFDVDIDNFEVVEATALCLYCKPELVACTCPTAVLLDMSNKPLSARKRDFKGWPLILFVSADFPAIDSWSWSWIRQQPTRTIRSGTYGYTLPGYKICADIGDHLNATMKSLKVDEEGKALGTMIIFGAWFTNYPLGRNLAFELEGVRFGYCANRTDVFFGDTPGLFAPFDSGTWACVVTALGGMSAVFGFTHGRTRLFHLLVCLVSQGRIFIGKLALLWVIWIAGAGTLQNFYTSFIESVLVVPPAASTLNDFEQLYTAGYHIVMGKDEKAVATVKRGLFGGTPYLDALRDSMEYHGKNFFDSKFLSYALNGEKKAFTIGGLQTPGVRRALRHAIPWKECHISQSELPLLFKGWSAIQFTAPLVHSLFHWLFASGILKLLMDSKATGFNEFVEKRLQSAARDAFYGANRGVAEGLVKQEEEWRDGKAALDFSIGNSQLKMIFLMWLAALGLSVITFCIEYLRGQVRKFTTSRASPKGEIWAVSPADL